MLLYNIGSFQKILIYFLQSILWWEKEFSQGWEVEGLRLTQQKHGPSWYGECPQAQRVKRRAGTPFW